MYAPLNPSRLNLLSNETDDPPTLATPLRAPVMGIIQISSADKISARVLPVESVSLSEGM